MFVGVPSMSDVYSKPQLDASQLCNKLRSQGLTIRSESEAHDVLNRCSYYRFKAYLRPFLDVKTKTYSSTISFEDSKSLYLFDEKLRCLVFGFIQKIEISIRTIFSSWITRSTNNIYWYLDSSIFYDGRYQKYSKTINKVKYYFSSSKEKFAEHFKENYFNDFSPFHRELPPAWVAVELMTFGNILDLMNSVERNARQRLKMKRFSTKEVGVSDYETLLNWLSVIKEVRNICCHHSRLFNKNIQACKKINNYLKFGLLDISIDGEVIRRHNRIYGAIAAMQVLMSFIGYEKLGPKLKALFEEFPIAKCFMDSMGFPQNWEDETLFFEAQTDR